jgi:hypothetical protein
MAPALSLSERNKHRRSLEEIAAINHFLEDSFATRGVRPGLTFLKRAKFLEEGINASSKQI